MSDEPQGLDARLRELVRGATIEALGPIQLHMQSLAHSVEALAREQRTTNGRMEKGEAADLALAHRISDHDLHHARVEGVAEGRKEVQAVLTKSQLATLATLGAVCSSIIGVIVRFTL